MSCRHTSKQVNLVMQTFDQHLLQMYQQRLIAGPEALRWSTRPQVLATAMRGIKYVGSGSH